MEAKILIVFSLIPLASSQHYLCVTCPPQRDPVTWAQWGEWGPCMNTGGYTTQTRVRSCDALSCDAGLSQEARACTISRDPPATVAPPQWAQWGAWGQCSASCGGGIQQRQRTCIMNVCNVCTCQGPSTEQQPCNASPCCSWTAWSPWSECSATCGSGGYRSRTRQCSCYTGCTGPTSEQETCNGPAACPAPPTQCDTCAPIVTPPPCYTCYNPCLTCGYYGKKKRAIASQLRGAGPQMPSNSTSIVRRKRMLGFIPQ
ncbi:hypothetical protein PRIPAC_75869 [Pristionchus pacificus]|uniref:Uncharacterized protein n=1 Tax=Pristionchus pacificus TaxID=54126 RepID=A0A2A6CFU1_PRIPA|nr:hypothetical protein PRIPAC_75869 [Pristionchus pacificus]|eukprot:PDM76947.1 hypothetical protein PRIPAC_42342 [Pristionchus pacificus]